MMKDLPAVDAYALALKLVGKDYSHLDVTATTHLLLKGYDSQDPLELNALKHVLDRAGVLKQVLAVDPSSPPPAPSTPASEIKLHIPQLLEYAQLSDSALKQAETVAHWYNAARIWASQRSPMSPASFLEMMLIWSLGLATAGRIGIQVHETIYPHLFVMLIAESSMYSKSTARSTILSLIKAAMPHMLIPPLSTPEGFLEILSGGQPKNADRLSQQDKELLAKGLTVAGQRGMAPDEYTSILETGKKDFMQSLFEIFMRAYDAGESESYYTRSGGLIIVKNPRLPILGTTVLRGVANAPNSLWENGFFARHLMMVHTDPLPYNPDFISPTPPPELVTTLRDLNQLAITASETQASGEFKVVYATMTKEAQQQYQAYMRAVFYEMLLDDAIDVRIRPNYRRLHIQALKISLSLASGDWAQGGGQGTPVISLGHWAIAQEMCEQARASLHRLLPLIDETRDARAQGDLLTLLRHHPNGLTTRDMCRAMNKPAAVIKSALEVLMESGLVEMLSDTPLGRTKRLTIFRAL